MTEQSSQLVVAHREAKHKFIYFLLASAGASIGFAISINSKLPLSWPSVLVITAILFWALSFACGIRAITLHHRMIAANSQFLKQLAQVPNAQKEGYIQDAEKKVFQPQGDRLNCWETAQIVSIGFGALLLMAWRIASAYPDFTPF